MAGKSHVTPPKGPPPKGQEDESSGSPQVFLPRANLFYRAVLLGGPVLALVAGFIWYEVYRSPYVTDVRLPIGQPVMFSHRHHSGELKIDCRYCHTSVEKSWFAGVPPTTTCMTCHSQLFKDSPLLQPVRESAANNMPIAWNRVHYLPDYVYFNHSIHVNKGVGCTTCHGQVNEMPLTWKSNTLFMAVVPAMPPRAGEIPAAALANLQHGLEAGRRPGTRRRGTGEGA